MSLGRMSLPITIVREGLTQSPRGFTEPHDATIASCKAYYEPKHGSAKWANLASFSTATALFRFRRIYGAEIDVSCFIVCTHGRFRLLSVENVRERGMYYECLADKVEPAVR